MAHGNLKTIDVMGLSHTVQTTTVKNIQVSDIGQEQTINLPVLYTKDRIPVSQKLGLMNISKGGLIFMEWHCRILKQRCGYYWEIMYRMLIARLKSVGPLGSAHITKHALDW